MSELSKEEIGLKYKQSQSSELYCKRAIIEDPIHLKKLQDFADEAEYIGPRRPQNATGSWKHFVNLRGMQENEPELYNYLVERTYPYNEPPVTAWLKWYGEGHMSNMHTDREVEECAGVTEKENLIYITAILLKSDNVVGGNIVVADDMSADMDFDVRINQRLRVLDITEPGYGVIWNEYTAHGVTQIESGTRITLMVTKRSQESRRDFGWEPQKYYGLNDVFNR